MGTFIPPVSEASTTTEGMTSLYERLLLCKRNDTRILRDLPALLDGTDTIACQLEVISMNAVTEYRALSYVRGDSLATRVILVNGAPLDVWLNLWHFLTRMRQ
jgi:hypothetical protein